MLDRFAEWFVSGCGQDERVDWRICLLARVELVVCAGLVIWRLVS